MAQNYMIYIFSIVIEDGLQASFTRVPNLLKKTVQWPSSKDARGEKSDLQLAPDHEPNCTDCRQRCASSCWSGSTLPFQALALPPSSNFCLGQDRPDFHRHRHIVVKNMIEIFKDVPCIMEA